MFSPSLVLFTVEKMKQIDKEYENSSCSGEKMFPFQTHLANYRKETRAQLEAEMNTKVGTDTAQAHTVDVTHMFVFILQ